MAKRDPTKPGTFKSKRTAKAEPFAQHVRAKQDAADAKARERTPALSGMAAAGRRLVEEAVGRGPAMAFAKALRQVEAITLEDVTATIFAAQVLLSEGLKKHPPKDDGGPPLRELALVDALHLQVKMAKVMLEVAEAYRVRGGGLPHKVTFEFAQNREGIAAAALPNGVRPDDAPPAPVRERGPGGDGLGVA